MPSNSDNCALDDSGNLKDASDIVWYESETDLAPIPPASSATISVSALSDNAGTDSECLADSLDMPEAVSTLKSCWKQRTAAEILDDIPLALKVSGKHVLKRSWKLKGSDGPEYAAAVKGNHSMSGHIDKDESDEAEAQEKETHPFFKGKVAKPSGTTSANAGSKSNVAKPRPSGTMSAKTKNTGPKSNVKSAKMASSEKRKGAESNTQHRPDKLGKAENGGKIPPGAKTHTAIAGEVGNGEDNTTDDKEGDDEDDEDEDEDKDKDKEDAISQYEKMCDEVQHDRQHIGPMQA
ncbi:hypothetical protein BYT27DRAFT_7209971 [Phlegmacium glaucopus]|nr:hypothetical protein BYT27DRAFT_7209971 [Phlegmacium glaucopus]